MKNGRTDDVMWEFGLGEVKRGKKEEEVREAEEKQVDIFMATFVPLLTFVKIVAILSKSYPLSFLQLLADQGLESVGQLEAPWCIHGRD